MPKLRNPYVESARFRKAGSHTSTDKHRGGKRGSKAGDPIEEQLEEYYEGQNENSQEDQE